MIAAKSVISVVSLALILVACDDGETTPSTSTTVSTPSTTAPGASTTTTVQGQTSTTLLGQVITDYQRVARLPTSNGEIFHLVIPVGGYTDIDLYNFLADLKQADPGLWGAEVFDHPDAPGAFAVAESERTEEQRDLLSRHHLVSLVAGDTIRYQGPFSSLPESVIGS